MKVNYYKNYSKYSTIICIILILLYLTYGTGLHGDDYSVINKWNTSNFLFLTPENLGLKIFGIPDYLIFWWVYPIFGYDYQWIYDLVKWVTHLASIFMVWHFFSVFLSSKRALAASLFFILSPLHETTTYWYMTAPYVFWPAVIMFSFYLFYIDRLKWGFMLGTIGAFSGYLSPPYVFGLSLILFIRKEYSKGFLFITPGLLYIIYYFYIKINFPFVEKRINDDINVFFFLKGISIQFFAIIDSLIGLSALIKIYYSTLSIGVFTFSICFYIIFSLWWYIGNTCQIEDQIIIDRNNLNKLLIGSISVLVLATAMFALTGLYVPSPFNLGNRSLVYGSLLVAVFFASLNINRKNLLIVGLIFLFPIFGLSDHWKDWNKQQLSIINNIKNHQGLRALKKNDILIVIGNNYNKLGPYSHIEFFSMPWVVNSIFKDFSAIENSVAITQTIFLEGDEMVDSKFGVRYSIKDDIYIYDSENNALRPGTRIDIENLIMNRKQEIRHWVQLARGTYVESAIVYLSPRLQYLFLK
jgi:hypothetical protein